MIRWDEMIPCFNLPEKGSDRIVHEEAGLTIHGNPFLVMTVSSP